jgi:hypothetical protein
MQEQICNTNPRRFGELRFLVEADGDVLFRSVRHGMQKDQHAIADLQACCNADRRGLQITDCPTVRCGWPSQPGPSCREETCSPVAEHLSGVVCAAAPACHRHQTSLACAYCRDGQYKNDAF